MQVREQLQPGTRLGHALVVESHLGSGGMGTVYLARDELLDRRVAVKLLHGGDVEALAWRTLLEGRATARVVHPHVVAVHAIGNHGGVPYIEMEWVDGGTLRHALAAWYGLPAGGARLPDRTARATWIAQLAAALQHAHEAGVVHCDVKPENVLLRKADADGAVDVVKLADFGLARSRADGSDARALSQGTVAYLAPELADGPPSPAADQFALAIVAMEMLCGVRPLRQTWTDPPQLAPDLDLPPAARVALQKALSPQAETRFRTVTAFADALLRGLGLAGARAPLVNGPLGAESPATTSDLPIPVLARSLPDLDLDAQIMAVLAVLPAGYPGALRTALGQEPPPALLAALRLAGKIDGAQDDWRLQEGAGRERWLAPLTSKQRRLVCASVAAAVEARGPKREPVREDATRLYIAARRLEDAARLALESAAAAKNARARHDHHGRAVSLLSSPMKPLPWLNALALQCEWALQCGWLQAARAPLIEAQGVLADVRLDRHDPIRKRLTIAGAQWRKHSGDNRGAAATLQRLIDEAGPEPDPWTLMAHARLVSALARDNRRADARRHGLEILALHEHQTPPRGREAWLRALGLLHATTGTAALRDGDLPVAEAHLHRAIALHQEEGNALATAEAILALGNLMFECGHVTKAEAMYLEAGELIAPLGPIELSAIVHANLGDCHVKLGRPWPALRMLLRAQVLFDEHGLEPQQVAVLRSLAAAWTAVGDAEEAAECLKDAQTLEDRRRRLRR